MSNPLFCLKTSHFQLPVSANAFTCMFTAHIAVNTHLFLKAGGTGGQRLLGAKFTCFVAEEGDVRIISKVSF